MKNSRVALITVGALALVAVIVFGVISLVQPGAEPTSMAQSTRDTSSSVPFAQPTMTAAAQTAAPTTSAPAPSSAPSSAKASDGAVPLVAPTQAPINAGGLEHQTGITLSAEEKQARDTIYRALPILLNADSHQYTGPTGARDDLLSQGLITKSLADSYFHKEFSPFEQALNKSGFVVQTTGMDCAMKTQGGDAIQMGVVTCYYSRQYVDSAGTPVSAVRWQNEIGGAGTIDPTQIQRAQFGITTDSGVWKINGVQLFAQ